MSDCVVRLSSSQIGNAASVKNLVSCLIQKEHKKYLVVSALPDILDCVHDAVEATSVEGTESLMAKLESVFFRYTGREASASYNSLSVQVRAILTGIQLIGDYSVSLKDQLVSFSEKLTTEIFKVILDDAGIQAEVLWPEHFRLTATNDFGNATFLSVDLQFLSGLPEGYYLIPGSYGVTRQGKISRAGKSAADYTAAFLTKEVGAEKLELWGIDKAFNRADPLVVPEAQKIKRLTYAEASELAYFDHFSFHPRAVEPLEHDHIPILVMNTDSDKGESDTVINTETFVEEQVVKSVASSDDISLLKLNGPGVGLKPGILARVTSRLNEEGINIRSVITSQISINLILGRKAGYQALAVIRDTGFTSVKEISVIDDVSLIGVVGHGMQQNYGVSAKIFNAMADNQINVVLSGSGASDLVSYLVVTSSDKDKSVKKIYEAFFKQINHSIEIQTKK